MKVYRVLVYDDNPEFQQALRKAYFAHHLEWEIIFAASVNETLQLIENQAFDALVCNVHETDRSALNLFVAAYNKRPETLRFALLDRPNMEMRIELAKYAHQCIAKPFDARDLITTLVKSLNDGSLMESADLKQLIGKIKTLPSLPKLYTEITEEIRSPSMSIERIGTLVERDPAICAKVLQLVNSAFFGLKQNIVNPTQALTFLGVDTIRDLVLTCGVFSQFDAGLLKRLGLNFLWDHSVSVSVYAGAITRSEDFSKSMIAYSCTAGLLHDLGKLILAQNFPTAYYTVLNQAKKKKSALHNTEIEKFGASHAEVGAYLLKLWGLPAIVVAAVGYHHFPAKNPTSDFSPTTAVHVANYFDLVRHPYHGCGANELDMRYLLDLKIAEQLPTWEMSCALNKSTPNEM